MPSTSTVTTISNNGVIPWLTTTGQPKQRQALFDINKVNSNTLKSKLGLSAIQTKKLISLRRKSKIRNLTHLRGNIKFSSRQLRKISDQCVFLHRPEVSILNAQIDDKRLYSKKNWGLRIEFVPPNLGEATILSVEVRWKGKPFVLQQKISKNENAKGLIIFKGNSKQQLPPGPVEFHISIFDSLGGADNIISSAWVYPSNPYSLFISPLNRSIYNGSVRPDFNSPNWVTSLNLTFVNGDDFTVRLRRQVTWKFWDGGVGGSLVESGTFDWPSTISLGGGGRTTRSLTFTSPPGSGIHDRYQDKEDMTIELIFRKEDGTNVRNTITCRVMAGWGVNIIMVGDYNGTERNTISTGINDARDVYEDHGLTFTSVDWWIIEDDRAGGYPNLGSRDEWSDLLDDWSVQNNSVDCFIVRSMWDSFAGWSPIGGPDSKGGKNDGLAATFSMVCFAHELGHYMGDLNHADSEGRGNVMHSICGGRNFTYNQYKNFLKHNWTRVVRD